MASNRKVKKAIKRLENKLKKLIKERGITRLSVFVAPDKNTKQKHVLEDLIYALEHESDNEPLFSLQ